MKRFMTLMVAVAMCFGMLGCQKKAVDEKTTETTVKTPGGSTTTTTETKVEKKGDHAPEENK